VDTHIKFEPDIGGVSSGAIIILNNLSAIIQSAMYPGMFCGNRQIDVPEYAFPGRIEHKVPQRPEATDLWR